MIRCFYHKAETVSFYFLTELCDFKSSPQKLRLIRPLLLRHFPFGKSRLYLSTQFRRHSVKWKRRAITRFGLPI
jgi:hypothetical protein